MSALRDADGLALMLIFGMAGTALLAVALVVEWIVERRTRRWQRFTTPIDFARCDRTGSQAAFARELHISSQPR